MSKRISKESSARQEALYAFLLKRDDRWTTMEEATDSVNLYPTFYRKSYHDSDARRMLTRDIQQINLSPLYDKIILSETRGIKLATKNEAASFLHREAGEIFRKLKRIRQMDAKISRSAWKGGSARPSLVEAKMAERRMFCKSVTESDQFLSLPADAQALYFHLNMSADDDGFCDNPHTVMRQCGASDDSMKLLIAKKFVLTFEKNDGFIVVVKHWRMNNYIRKDTYRETRYREFMRELYYDENQSYSMNPRDGHVPCLSPKRNDAVTAPSRVRNEPLTQDRIGKDKDSLEIVKDIDSTGNEGVPGGTNELITDVCTDPQKEVTVYPEGADAEDLTGAYMKEKRKADLLQRINWFQKMGWDPAPFLKMAADEGIQLEGV